MNECSRLTVHAGGLSPQLGHTAVPDEAQQQQQQRDEERAHHRDDLDGVPAVTQTWPRHTNMATAHKHGHGTQTWPRQCTAVA